MNLLHFNSDSIAHHPDTLFTRFIRNEKLLKDLWGPLRIASPNKQKEKVLRCLLAAIPEGIFLSTKELDGPKLYYSRLMDHGDVGDSYGSSKKKNDFVKTIANMHTKSIVNDKKNPPRLVFALDFMLFGAEMPKNKIPIRFVFYSHTFKLNG